LELEKVTKRLVDHQVTLLADAAALDLLAELGFDPEMGARPLRRIIQQKVEDPLSDALLSGKFADGDTIQVEVKDGDIELRQVAGETAPPEAMPAA
jgi:ATP-dependent Clp protease ATP-binding subunit ClpA